MELGEWNMADEKRTGFFTVGEMFGDGDEAEAEDDPKNAPSRGGH